jgi:hypothetical protein
MKISFTKINHESHTVHIKRNDGSEASVILDTPTYFFHDICHYVVEKKLNAADGFWGMLNKGYGFEELSGKENQLTAALRHIECIIGPVQSVAQGFMAADFFPTAIAYLEPAFDATVILQESLLQIEQLQQSWKKLSFGESLLLEFDIIT